MPIEIIEGARRDAGGRLTNNGQQGAAQIQLPGEPGPRFSRVLAQSQCSTKRERANRRAVFTRSSQFVIAISMTAQLMPDIPIRASSDGSKAESVDQNAMDCCEGVNSHWTGSIVDYNYQSAKMNRLSVGKLIGRFQF